MGFLNPKQLDDEGELPGGGAGLHLDLDVKVCPSCRTEAPPWTEDCPSCGTAMVAPDEVPARGFALPGLAEDPSPDDADVDDRGSRDQGPHDPGDDGEAGPAAR